MITTTLYGLDYVVDWGIHIVTANHEPAPTGRCLTCGLTLRVGSNIENVNLSVVANSITYPMSPELIALLNATLEEAPALVANKAENAEESEDDLCSAGPFPSLLDLLTRVIQVDEYFDKLRFFFDDNLLLAALDLVDRQNGACHSCNSSGSCLT